MKEDAASALGEGSMVGAYRVLYRLGGGGMGAVYAAEEPTIHKRVAIKVLHLSLASDASLAARFEREARAANDVRHPAVVDCFAFGKLDDGRPYLVMSLLEGRSLSEEIASRTRLPATEAWALLREIAEALVVAHEVGIVHRDLKPDNVFVERIAGRPPRARLLDLGLVKVLSRGGDDLGETEAVKLTQTGAPMGTPVYMAPEQWWGKEVDERVDQYALGATLFEMLAGAPPFRSKQYIELAQEHMNAPVPPLSADGVEVEPAIEQFLQRTLAKAPEDRYPSMRELIENGDRAFGPPPSSPAVIPFDPGTSATKEVAAEATSKTELAGVSALPVDAAALEKSEGEKAVTPRAPARVLDAAASFRRFLSLHLIFVVGGVLALVAVGYACEIERDVVEWVKSGGYPALAVVIVFGLAAVGIVPLASRRARGEVSFIPWVVALSVAVFGVTGSSSGLHKSLGAMEKLESPSRFVLLQIGTFEALSGRFMGLSLAGLLFASIAASTGIAQVRLASETLTEPLGQKSREALLAAVGLAILSVVALVLGAPSASFTAGVASGVVSLGALLPLLDRRTAARDEIQRASAGLLAVALVFLGGLTRLDARYAGLWRDESGRAVRAAEVVAASRERSLTIALGLASLVVVAAIEAVTLRRLWGTSRPLRPTPKTLLLVVVTLGLAIFDLVEERSFEAVRTGLRADLDAQFSLFAHLDPPGATDLDPKTHAPHAAPAMQITAQLIALNAKGVAPLSAAASPDGAINIGHDISHAVAEHAATAKEPVTATDLSIAIDRKVAWSDVSRLLSIARRAGVRRVEILLTRGTSPVVPEGAPVEANWVLASDFVAVAAELGEAGFTAEGGKTFGEVVPDLVGRAATSSGPLVLAAPDP